MPLRGRIHRRAKEPRERYWGDPLFFQFVNTLSRGEQEHIEQALQEYFPSQKSHFASYHSTRKYDRPQPVLNRQLWEISKLWTIQHFQVAMGGARLTSPSVYAWSLRPWTTPGFPMVQKWPTKGQALIDESFWDFYEEYKAALFAWDVLWGSTVKSDELRPPEKIALSELRTFLSSPIHHNIALGEMCADMNERLKNSTSTWSTLGRSNFNREWHQCMARLKHPNFFGGDLSNQDASMFQDAMLEQAEIRFEMYDRELQTDENWERLSNLYIQIVFSLIVLAQGEVVEKDTGNPSGSGNTITDNTIVIFRCLAYSWLMLWLEKYETFDRFSFQEEFRYSCFMANVDGNIIGDDSLLSVSARAVVVFNARGIVRMMWTMFIVHKPENEEPLPDFSSLSYCSHTSKVYYGTYVPVMEYSRGVASLGWKGASLLHREGKEVDDPSVHYTLQRALDIRREGFWNDRLFKLCDAFVRWILETHGAELQKPAVSGPIAGKPLHDIMVSFLTPSAMVYLYTGKEAAVKQSNAWSGRPTASKDYMQATRRLPLLFLMKKTKSKKFSQVIHDAVIEPLEDAADKVTRAPVRLINSVAGTKLDPLGTAFHKGVFTEMSSKSSKKASQKAKRKKKKRKNKMSTGRSTAIISGQMRASVKQRRKAFKKFNHATGKSKTPAGMLGVRGARPRNIRLNTSAGLTMKGGVISGTTELTPDLVVSLAEDVAGTVLITLPINALAIAPGSRFANFSANYDEYVFEELQVCIEPDMPYTDSIMIAGGLEHDPLDDIPAPGGLIDVQKYMEHENFHAESLIKSTKSGACFPKNKRAVIRGGKGPKSGMYFNRLPVSGTTNTDLTTVQQGTIIIFVHTADQGSLEGDDIHLGPVLLKWRCRFREAAERNEHIASEDSHHQGNPVSSSDLMGWVGASGSGPALQSTIQTGSTMELPTGGSTNNLWVLPPPGYWEARLEVDIGTAGSSAFQYVPFLTAQANMSVLLSDGTTGGTVGLTHIAAYTRFRITGPPSTNSLNGVPAFKVFVASGTATSWTFSDARFWLRPIPAGMLTALTHRNLRVRGLAWVHAREQMRASVQLSSQVAQALKAHGVETKDPVEEEEKRFHKRILAEVLRAPPVTRRYRETTDELDDTISEAEYELGIAPGIQLRSDRKQREKLLADRADYDRRRMEFSEAEEYKVRSLKAVKKIQARLDADELIARAREEEVLQRDHGPEIKEETKQPAAVAASAPPELSVVQKMLSSGWSLVRTVPSAAAPSTSAASL